MGKSAGMGKYFIRKDGTTVENDHRDRRYKLVHKESVASPGENDAGQKHTFKGSELTHYTFNTPTGVKIVTASTLEGARSQVPKGSILEKSERITKKRKK